LGKELLLQSLDKWYLLKKAGKRPEGLSFDHIF